MVLSKQIFKQARDYRDSIGKLGGVVIFYDGEIQGWVNELRDPDQWVPGCIALGDGAQWVASGGDKEHGATHWLPLTSNS